VEGGLINETRGGAASKTADTLAIELQSRVGGRQKHRARRWNAGKRFERTDRSTKGKTGREK